MIYMQNPDKQRYYLLLIEQDLFGTWCLKKAFGSLVNRRERVMIQTFASKKEAWQELTEVEYKKRQRGYIYSDMVNPEHFYLRPQNLNEIKPQVKVKSNKIMSATKDFEPDIDTNQLDLFIDYYVNYNSPLQETY